MKFEGVFTFFDLKRLYVKHWRALWSFGVLITFCVTVFLWTRPLTYKSEVVLKVPQPRSQMHSKMQELFPHFSDRQETGSALALLLSHTLLRAVVEEGGLQVTCEMNSWPLRVLHRLKGYARAVWAEEAPEEEYFSFSAVHVVHERPLQLWLRLDEQGKYEIFDANRERIACSVIGSEATFSFGKLTLNHAPLAAKLGVFYPVRITPWFQEVVHLRKGLKVSPLKEDKTLIRLEWRAPHRALGLDILNRFMTTYQRILRQENAEMCEFHLKNLHRQKDALIEECIQVMGEQRSYFGNNREGGCLGYEQEVEVFTRFKDVCALKLIDIDLELRRLPPLDVNEAIPSSALSLKTITKLLEEQTSQKKNLQSQLTELNFLQTHIHAPEFALHSLGAVFEDEVTKQLVHQASAVTLQLKDSNNRSVHEQERLQEMLTSQKQFLAQYLAQMCGLKTSKLHFLDEHIRSLQQTSFVLLQAEKQILQNKIKEINVSMQTLPEKWQQEALFTLKQEQLATQLKGVSQAIETWLLEKQSFFLNARAVDEALVSYLPQSKMLLGVGLASLLVTLCGGYFVVLCSTLMRGFPVSVPMLRAMKFPVGGTLGPGSNLETLRTVVQQVFSPSCGVAVCLGGKRVHDVCALGEILTKRGVKTLVLDCSWDQAEKMSFNGVDYIKMQGICDVDALCSSTFLRHLEEYRKTYETVLVYTQIEPSKMEGTLLLSWADVALVTVHQETLEQLSSYYEWSEIEHKGRAMFLCAQEVE